jgi:RNA-directed DNA polymerase
VKLKVSELLTPGNKVALTEVQVRLNRLLVGWSAYFSHGALAPAYGSVDDHVYDRVRSFLCKRHKAPGRGTKRFFREHVYGELGDVASSSRARKVADVCFTVKPVGKPDAGNPHVRFDKREGETERIHTRHRATSLF